MTDQRRSLRQTEILLQLEERPAKTITELAERMVALRPSVSRSLRGLKDQGLVHRTRKGWCLTEEGQVEAFAARAMLVDTTRRVQSMTENVADVWRRVEAVSGIEEMMASAARAAQCLRLPSVTNGVAKVVAGFQIPSAMESIAQTAEAFRGSWIESNSKMLEQALNPLIEVQKHNGILVSELAASMRLVGAEDFVRHNNLLLAHAIDNVLAIHQIEVSRAAEQVANSVDFSWVSSQLADVSRSFEQMLSYYIEQAHLTQRPIPLPLLTERITVPTAMVAHYITSLRDLVEADTELGVSLSQGWGFEEVGDQSLDSLLCELDYDFVEMRRGSWSVLRAGGPDRLRHAGTSQRELIRQVLQMLVPDIELPEDSREGPQIKARVRVALGISESDAEFVDVICRAVYSYYCQLNKYTHHNEKHEESLRALLHTGEGLLRFILTMASERREQQ